MAFSTGRNRVAYGMGYAGRLLRFFLGLDLLPRSNQTYIGREDAGRTSMGTPVEHARFQGGVQQALVGSDRRAVARLSLELPRHPDLENVAQRSSVSSVRPRPMSRLTLCCCGRAGRAAGVQSSSMARRRAQRYASKADGVVHRQLRGRMG
jgi:hypothetical protein